MDVYQLLSNVEDLHNAVSSFAETLTVTQGFSDPGSGIPGSFGCTEANVFVELLDALGLTDLATDFRVGHADSEDADTVADMHEHWPDGIRGKGDTSDPFADMEGELIEAPLLHEALRDFS